MKRVLLLVLLFVTFFAGTCRGPYQPNVDGSTPNTMPVYIVTEPDVAADRAGVLAGMLGVPERAKAEHGALRYMAEDFGAVPTREAPATSQRDEDGLPTVGRAFDFAALRQTKAPDESAAVQRFQEAARKAGLPIFGDGPIQATASIGHSRFAAVGSTGQPLTDPAGAILDTHVSYALKLDGVPLIGPGAEVKAAFDHQLRTTLLRVALRGVKRGDPVPIVPGSSACEEAFQSKSRGYSIQVRPTLVYYAPPPEITTVQALYPHYLCEGTLLIDKRTVPLRRLVVPAIANAPAVTISADPKGDQVTAIAKIRGGTPPYTFAWNGPGGGARNTGPQTTFSLDGPRSDRGTATVSVVATDANGLRAWAMAPLGIATSAFSLTFGSESAAFVVGTEWIGVCGGLGGSAANAGGFVAEYSAAGATTRFNWGNENAWQRDFLDTDITPTGLDQDYVDNSDFTFYTGHANGDGFTFCSEQNTGFLSYTDQPKWGDRDLEWLIIAACGPLQFDSGGQAWWQRWGPAFDGLHLYMGYQTVTADNELEGTVVATRTLDGWTVRQAWIEAALETQGESEIWAVMGVLGPDGLSNWDDHVWGHGSVGPDIRGGNIRGYWMTWGPS